jgi:hypothetical protein
MWNGLKEKKVYVFFSLPSWWKKRTYNLSSVDMASIDAECLKRIMHIIRIFVINPGFI